MPFRGLEDVRAQSTAGAPPRLVLVVGHQEQTRAMYADWLTYSGFHVTEAKDVSEALTKARSLQPDVIAADIGPEDDLDAGYLVETLKTSPGTRGIPLIAVTLTSAGGARQRARTAGCDAVLLRPCLPSTLLTEIERLLESAVAGAPADLRSRRPTATLADVDIHSELQTRPSRVPDYKREQEALGVLAAEMAGNPRNMLQKLAEIAVELCDAHTAGISLLDGDVFRWEAVAGVHKAARGGSMPRSSSPCGVCIDRDTTQVMHLADRCFPALWAEPRFVEALLIPFHHQGTAIGTVWIVSHTVERKFDREDERIVRALTGFASAGWQLWKATEAAQQTTRQKDDFLAMLGHELRNPLAAISMAVPLVEHRLASDDVGKRRLQVIARQVRHAARLVEDLLDTARIGRGNLQLTRTAVDLGTILTEAIEMTRPQIERRAQKLSVVVGTGPVVVDGDPNRLVQVLVNLIDNAAKFTPYGGQISVSIASKRDEVSIEVRDTGIGLPDDQLERIFEPFTQFRDKTASVGGLGLGLALVRSLTELHGGTVRADSAGPGSGSCFTVRLPLIPRR